VLAGAPGYLGIEEIAIAFGPYRTGEDLLHTQGDAVGVDLRVSWGLEA